MLLRKDDSASPVELERAARASRVAASARSAACALATAAGPPASAPAIRLAESAASLASRAARACASAVSDTLPFKTSSVLAATSTPVRRFSSWAIRKASARMTADWPVE